MSVSSDMRVNASRSRDRARAGAVASSPASSMRSGARLPSIVTRHKLKLAVLPEGSVDDGAAVSRPCQGMDVAGPLRRQPAGRLRRGARRIDFDQSHIAIPHPCHAHVGRVAGDVRGAGRRAKRPASNRHDSSSRQSVARRRLDGNQVNASLVPCHRGAASGDSRSSVVRSSRPPATYHPVTSPVNRRL